MSLPTAIPSVYGGESTWNEVLDFALTGGGIGYTSGGGMSSLYGVPSYQQPVSNHAFTTLLGNQIKATGRMTPDVSFNSAVYGGVMAYLGFLSRWAVFGGTSAASPAWAGHGTGSTKHMKAEMDSSTPQFTASATANHSTTSLKATTLSAGGSCGEDGFLAGKGYDLDNRLGTPGCHPSHQRTCR